MKIIENGSYSEEEVDISFTILESFPLPPELKERMFLFMHSLVSTEESKAKMNMNGNNGLFKQCVKRQKSNVT